MKQCPTCGRQFPDEFQFCQDDAAKLAPIADAAAAPGAPKWLGKAAVAVLVIAVVAAIAGALLHHTPASSASASGASATLGNPTSGTQTSWQTYRNPDLGFACDYPAGWTLNVAPSRASPGATRVLFQSPDPDVAILVDAERGTTGQAPLRKWQDLDGRFRSAYKDRYDGMGVQETRLAGCDAAIWRSTLQHTGGPRLEREDIGTTIAGRDYALLLSAPPDRFDRWQSAFDHVAQSFATLSH